MNPYFKFVETFRNAVEQAKDLTVSGQRAPLESDRKALLFSPHPDDEVITGLLPLRLMREAGMQIINVPVTFGSKVERRAGRAEELKTACDYLGFHCLEAESRGGQTDFQGLEKKHIVEILKTIRPRIVLMPHSKDWNSRHIETHRRVMAALAAMPAGFSCRVVETEYWGAMSDPNLMVEADAHLLADLIAALSLHTGEVARNPYHLLLPAWMMDNVRRGGEVVLGQGAAPPPFTFATLYRLRRWENGRIFQTMENGRALACSENAEDLL